MIKYQDAAFLMMFYVRDPEPVESRRKLNLGPLMALDALDLWAKGVGKVLNLSWHSAGAVPKIATFRSGD